MMERPRPSRHGGGVTASASRGRCLGAREEGEARGFRQCVHEGGEGEREIESEESNAGRYI